MSSTVVRTPVLTEAARQVIAANLAHARRAHAGALLGIDASLAVSLPEIARTTETAHAVALLRAHVAALVEQAATTGLGHAGSGLAAQAAALDESSAAHAIDAATRAAAALEQQVEAAAAARHARQLATDSIATALRAIGMAVEVTVGADGVVTTFGVMTTGEAATVVVDEHAVIEAHITDSADAVPGNHPAAHEECVRASELAAAFDKHLREALANGGGKAGAPEVVEAATRGDDRHDGTSRTARWRARAAQRRQQRGAR